MSIYAQNHGCYPSMQPTNITPRCNGGVRDLYPLYLSAMEKPEFLKLFRPPGVALVPFSKNPGPDEFDSDHIGYIYNSTIVPDQSDNPPLMAERCVEDGMFTKDEKPVFKDCAHILMANGIVKEVPVVKGKLSLGDIKLEDLGKLK